MDAVKAQFRIMELENELRARASQVSMLQNLLEQMYIAAQDEDYDEIVRIYEGVGDENEG